MTTRWTLTDEGWRSGVTLIGTGPPPPGFVPEYPGQPDPAIVPLWGEGIRVESETIRPDSPHVRLFGVPGEFGSSGEIATDLAVCRAYDATPHVSTKVPSTDWDAVANGSEDAFFTNATDGVFTRLQEHIDAGGKPGLFSVHHEPDGAGGDTQPGGADGTAAQHLAMNERVRTLMDANLTGWSLGPTFTGWMFRHSFLGTTRDPQIWVPADNPYDWVGADLYGGDPATGSVLEYGGSGVDINGVVRQGNPDRFLAFCRERGLDGYVPEWGVHATPDDDQDVRAFYDWCLANTDTIKGVIYYNRSLDANAEWQFYKDDRWPDPRAAEWIAIFNQRNRPGRATHVAYPPLDGMLVAGSSQTNNGAVTKFEGPGALEQLPVRRRFYTDFTSGSAGMIAAAVEDVAAARVPWVSSKFPDWQTAGNGGYDADIDTMLAGLGAIDGPVILSMNHEPEGGGGSNFPDQYPTDVNAPVYWCNAQQRVRERMTALGVTNICFAPILMGYTFKDASRPNGTGDPAFGAGWHRNPNLWWRDVDSNGDRIFDAYGIDWYVESGAVDGSVWQDNTFAEYGAIREFVENKGVDLMIGEWGSRDNVDGDTTGADQWARIDAFLTHLAGTHNDGNGARVTLAVYYDSTIAEDWHLRPVAETNYIDYLRTDPAVARLPDLLME